MDDKWSSKRSFAPFSFFLYLGKKFKTHRFVVHIKYILHFNNNLLNQYQILSIVHQNEYQYFTITPFLIMILSNTKLATSLSPEILVKIEKLGEQICLEPDQTLFQKGDNSDYLYVILEGELLIEMDSNSPIWICSSLKAIL